MTESSVSYNAAVEEEDDSEWEYEYHDTETEVGVPYYFQDGEYMLTYSRVSMSRSTFHPLRTRSVRGERLAFVHFLQSRQLPLLCHQRTTITTLPKYKMILHSKRIKFKKAAM